MTQALPVQITTLQSLPVVPKNPKRSFPSTSDSQHPSHDRKKVKQGSSPSSNPLGLKPLGNLLFSSLPSCRIPGLGALAILPDDLLLTLFSELAPEDLFRLQGTSKAFFAWCAGIDSFWKAGFIIRSQGRLERWSKNWRETYLRRYMMPRLPLDVPLPSAAIRCETMFSDVLFQPILCAGVALSGFFQCNSVTETIGRTAVKPNISTSLPTLPTILTGAMGSWPGYSATSPRKWSLDSLAKRFPTTLFRAEATLTKLDSYRAYHDACEGDESPLYLFDSDYVEKTEKENRPGMGEDFVVPEVFGQDLFSVLGDERPDYRWLIVGPARSGSTWHQDPNGTSAWNAVITGAKAWICFPPDVAPPGVMVSDDEGEVESPLSIAEWLDNYYWKAKATYGPNAKDVQTRGKMLEGICNPGEIFCVPSGWWHLVVNLSPSIAITQNYVSSRELPSVLYFMKHRPLHVSGFRLRSDGIEDHDPVADVHGEECETGTNVYDAFVEALERDMPEVAKEGLVKLAGLELERGIKKPNGQEQAAPSFWDAVQLSQKEFSFSFAI